MPDGALPLILFRLRRRDESTGRKGISIMVNPAVTRSGIETERIIREFILEEYLPGENPAALTNATPLITGRILDSLGTVKLVSFLEERFGIELRAHETMVDYLNTIDDITKLVHTKLTAGEK